MKKKFLVIVCAKATMVEKNSRTALRAFEFEDAECTSEVETIIHFTISKCYNIITTCHTEAVRIAKELFTEYCKDNNLTYTALEAKSQLNFIMDDSNGHNKKLVELINEIYQNPKNDNNLRLITTALYEKYKEEANDKGIVLGACSWDDFRYSFYKNVLSDDDLDVIIKFVHCW